MVPTARVAVVRFGIFEADFRVGELRKAGVKVKLHDQPFQVLAVLLDRPGQVVTREEIRKRLWPGDTFVDFDHGLNNAVARLREALGDSAGTPRFIETLPRKGYRFIASADLLEFRPDKVGAAAQALPPEEASRSRFSKRAQRILVVFGVAAVLAATTIFVLLLRSEPKDLRQQAIAILPLQNTSASNDLDFLRIGLADEIATTLSYVPALSIRPSAMSNRYVGPNVDVRKAAREMRVERIITGHFVIAGDKLEVTLEAINTSNNRVLWRDSVSAPVRDLTGMQRQIAARVEHGLVTALDANPDSIASSGVSHNPEAYELYLRALSEGDPINSQRSFVSANDNAIGLLRRAVALDPGFASAWATLGHRYYYAVGYEEESENRSRAKAALRRALALDPSRIDAASDLINVESEEGELNQAYDDVAGLLQQRPNSGRVHLVRSFVLWYAGLLDEAAKECEDARSLDAGTSDLASCAYVFIGLRKYDRAREYLQLQSGSEYENGGEIEILLREGKHDEALQKLEPLPVVYGGPLLQPCLQGHPLSANDPEVQKMRSVLMVDVDPFPKYALGAWDSLCGQSELAFHELRRAIEQNYCAYPQMETDPLLDRVRGMAEFTNIRSLGVTCQQRFLEHRRQANSR